jgi:ATP-binding cassette subfamily C protein CydCD
MNLDPRLLAQLRSTRVYLALTLLCGTGVGIAIVAQASTLAQIVARVFLHGDTLVQVWDAWWILLAIATVRALLAWISETSAFQIAARLKTDLRARVFARILARGPMYTRGERTGELTHALTEGIEALEAYFSQYIPQLVLTVLVPLLILAFVFPLDWLSAMVLFVTGPLIPFFMILIGSAADALTRKQYRELSLMSAHFLDVLQGLTTLKILGRSREQIETIARVSEQYRRTTLRVLRVAFLSAFALEMIATLSTAMVAVQVGLRLLYGQLQFEQAFFVLILAPDFYLPLRSLGTRFHAGMSGVAAAARIFAILEGETQDERVTDFSPNPSCLPLVLDNVHYSYDSERSALDGISCVIEPGQRVAIVGATGAGKSTFVNLLLRFIEPTHGKILCDGVPLDTIPPREWRAQMAWVPQLPYLFNMSIADNICLARPNAKRDEVIRAAQLASADEFIRALPQGYDTLVGERGARLSTGQAQRIALARAFFVDAPILILDEATAHLDIENETLIQQAIEQLMENRTVVMVTHHLATAARADKILVLDKGCLAETGTHDELIAQQGVYYQLVQAWQSQNRLGDGSQVSDDTQKENGEANEKTWESQETTTHNEWTWQKRFATLAQLITLVAPFKWLVALAVLLGAFTIGSSIGLMATSAYIIASAALHPSIADLAVPIVGVRFFGIARGVFRYLERYVSHDVNLGILARLRVWFYSAIEPGAPAQLFAAGRRSGDLLVRIIDDVETLQNFFVRILAPPFVALMIVIGMVVWLSVFSNTLTLVVLAFMFLVGMILPFAIQRISHTANQQLVQARAELTTQLVDDLQGIADLVAFGQSDLFAVQVHQSNLKLIRAQKQMLVLAGAQNAASNWFVHAATLCTLVIVIPLVTTAQVAGVYLPVIVLAISASFEGVLALPMAFQYLESNLVSARRLFEIATAPQQSRTIEISPSASIDPVVANPSICIRDLTFRYAPNEPLALDHVSFDVPSGKTLAVVGPSGAGKSTIFNLLLRFWNYEEGSITIGERDLKDIPSDQARRLFSVVSQPTHLFNGTIRENLLLGCPNATDAEMIRATEQSQIHRFISSLPLGYDTRIGEQGLRLSGGERQRLAIARALLGLRDAPILLLDEANAYLDPITEHAIIDAVRQCGRTMLLITHHLNQSDEIENVVVLHEGRVVPCSNH